MKFRLLIILLGILIPICAYSQKGLDAPMTKAVMNVYEKLLKENPSDYETYYRRAMEYYKHNVYSKALNDINSALKYTPVSEKALRGDQLMMRANIYQMTGKWQEALNDLNSALALDPTSYIILYQKANAEYNLGLYAEAKADFQRMQMLNNRSQEALIGLARIAVKENNYGLANDYCEQAVAIAPSQSEIYVRRASVRQMMGNDNGAVDDLILAISTENSNTKALQELVKLSNTNYSAVMTGLSNAIRQAPKVGMFYYIRAVIAESHYNYLAAITDYKKILYENLYNYAGIYGSLAKCYYALGNYEEALDNIDYALAASKNNKTFFATRAQILRAMDKADEAIEWADKALAKDDNYNDAIIVKALASIDIKQYETATSLLGEAAFNDAGNAYLYILRAWVLDQCMGQKSNANTFYNRVLDFPSDGVKSLKGFASLALGKMADANSWMANILSNLKESDGYEYYIGTCFYAQTGNTAKALDCMEKALEKGYANYHNWTKNNDGNINVAPLRDNPRFKELLQQYSVIFN